MPISSHWSLLVSEVLPVLTTCWGLVMALSPILQIRVIVRNQDASGTSPAWVAILIVGFLLWLSYGVVNQAPPLIITNTVSAIVGITLLVVIAVYRRRYATAQAPAGSVVAVPGLAAPADETGVRG
jgi:MtN3 and saliva related transmembrane protein